jgi:hypothetical protein
MILLLILCFFVFYLAPDRPLFYWFAIKCGLAMVTVNAILNEAPDGLLF